MKTMGESNKTLGEAIKNNKWKFVVVLAYALLVLISPVLLFTPYVQNTQRFALQSMVTQNEDSFFRNYISLLQQKNINQAYSLLELDAATTTYISTSSLVTLSTYFASTTNQIQVVGWSWRSYSGLNWNGEQGNWKIYTGTYEIKNNDIEHPYILFQATAENGGGGLEIVNLNVQAEKVSATQTPLFNSTDGVFLILALLIPLFIIYTAMRYLVKAQNPRWPMFLVIVLISLYFNINSAAQSINATFGFYGFLEGLWVFAIPIPLGAIYYYFVRKKYENPITPTEATTT